MNWQPIETAPRDGSWLLVWRDSYYGVERWLEWGDANMPRSGWVDAEEQSICPTHWMPLPEPPAALIVVPASHDRGAK